MINSDFWKGKKVFITGHTGFKGGWLSIWLNMLGAEVMGYSLKPNTIPSLFEIAKIDDLVESVYGDIRDYQHLEKTLHAFDPDILFHLAAQPLVRYSYKESIETYSTNVMGTVNVLEISKNCKNLKALINITSDKCYENTNKKSGYIETDPMGGFDPYSSSKGCAELVASSYRRSFYNNLKKGLASVRAGNVIGGGDWAEDRLIPDILKSFENKQPVIIRNPNATRPWQHVLEPLSGYLILAEKLYDKPNIYSEGWNFGPDDEDIKPVNWIIENIIKKWPGSEWVLDENSNPHEAETLKLDISKVKNKIKWKPTWNLDISLSRIISWHHNWKNGENMQRYSIKEINQYMGDMTSE